MAGSDIEAKNIHTKKIEELLVGPIFDIFHVQRAQLAEKTESQNSLLFHFKSSMAKVRTWNASTVKTFVSNLVERFPVLGAEFEAAFEELQQVTCRILNASSEVNTYEPLVASSHTHLHELISACADSFISFPEWFAVDDKSAEYQTCKNNAKVRMGQASVVPNTVTAFIKTSHREPAQAEDANSDMDIFEDDQSANSDISDISSIQGNKKINVKSGLVTQDTPGEEDEAAADVEAGEACAPAAPDVQDVTAEDEIRVDKACEASASAAEDKIRVDDYEDADDSMGSDESDEFTVTMDSDESFSGISLGSSEDDSESSASSSAEEGSGEDSEDSSDGMDYESASTGGESESTEEYSESSEESSEGSAASTEDYGGGESEGGGSESTEEFDDESCSSTEASSDTHSESSDSHVSGESSSEITLNWESVSDGSYFTAEGSDADFDV